MHQIGDFCRSAALHISNAPGRNADTRRCRKKSTYEVRNSIRPEFHIGIDLLDHLVTPSEMVHHTRRHEQLD